MNFLEDLKDKVVIITGSGRGIGKGIAEAFAEVGSKIVITDIDAETCAATAKEIAEKGVDTLDVVCDVSNRESVDEMIKKTVDKFGQIDVVVNNAGTTKDGLFMRMKPEQWQMIIDINLTGTYNVTHAAINVMRKKKSGNIINLSSVNALGVPGQANYAASKAGVIGFTKAIAKELAPMGIRVNALAPGFIETYLTSLIPEKMAEEMVKNIPMARKGQPEDIAKPILFLASDLSSYVTGEVLNVNGGLNGL